MDHDHSEVGGTCGKALLPALGCRYLKDGRDKEDTGGEEQAHRNKNHI